MIESDENSVNIMKIKKNMRQERDTNDFAFGE